MTKTLMRAIDAVDRATQPRLRAVNYLRVSTEEQVKGYGISAAAKSTTAYIERKGWEHVDTFKDPGVSGSLVAEHREDLNRLMTLARQTPRPFDVVVVSEQRVVGRTERAYYTWVWELEDLGICVADAKMDIDNTTSEGREKIREEAHYAFKEYERIRTRTQTGVQDKAVQGGYAGGRPRYGYRIENKGQKGESCLVVDDCNCHGTCAATHEADVLRRGRGLVIEYEGSWEKAALALNAEGLFTRSGKPWTRENLRHKLNWQDLLDPQIIWRNPKNVKKGKHRGVTLGRNDLSLYGETVTIPLPTIFTVEEVSELRRFVVSRPPVTKGRTYTVSKRLISKCGKYYIGGGGVGAGDWQYRCSGKEPEYAGAARCSCPSLNAEAVEAAVWEKVCATLGDVDRLKKLAAAQAARHMSSKVDYAKRIADFKRQIEEQHDAIDVTMMVAAKQAARRKLSRDDAERAVEKAVRPLNKDLAEMEKMLAEAEAWAAEASAAQDRARDIESLADLAKLRLDGVSVEQQARYMEMLNIRAFVKGEPPTRKAGRPCTVMAWFREHGKSVPELTDIAWAKVAHLMTGHHRADPRKMLAGILHKARTGCTWPEVYAEFGSRSVKTYWDRWSSCGRWEAVMELLADLPGTRVAGPVVRVPDLAIQGDIRPRLLLDHESEMLERCGSVSYKEVAIRFNIDLAA